MQLHPALQQQRDRGALQGEAEGDVDLLEVLGQGVSHRQQLPFVREDDGGVEGALLGGEP